MFDREIMQTNVSKSQSIVPISSFESRFRNEIKLAKLFRSSKNLNELLIGLKREIRQYFDAQAFTIYSVDNIKKEIVSKLIAGRLRQEIRLPIDKNSLTGYTALTRLSVNVTDAYDEDELKSIDQDLCFNRTWDDKTKFKTRQVLSVPIYTNKTLFGVIQLLNKKDGQRFSDDDEQNLKAIAEDRTFYYRTPPYPQKSGTTETKNSRQTADFKTLYATHYKWCYFRR